MNIIRTAAVELSSIPAIAYKLKLASGGAGLKLHHLNCDATAVFSIDKRTGAALPFRSVDTKLFPDEAVDEALELIRGIPYSTRGKFSIAAYTQTSEPEDIIEEQPETLNMVNSDEYKAIIDRYSDEKGKLNYDLMNKDFIQFASKSKMVLDMASDNAIEDDIIVHIIRNRAGYLANKKESLSDAEVKALIETLDEIDPRSALKELKNHLRRILAKK